MRRGVTLLEIVISALILAVAFIPILRVVTTGSTSTVKIGNYAKAANLARQLIEECKHVPFKEIQSDYKDLADGKSFEIKQEYYAETLKNLEKFREDNKSAMKDFDLNADLKVRMSEYNQIKEAWLSVEISWFDKGKIEGNKLTKRIVRAGSAYYNPEAI